MFHGDGFVKHMIYMSYDNFGLKSNQQLNSILCEGRMNVRGSSSLSLP
jgi:hypothetical protein